MKPTGGGVPSRWLKDCTDYIEKEEDTTWYDQVPAPPNPEPDVPWQLSTNPEQELEADSLEDDEDYEEDDEIDGNTDSD
jgi:hypothetical protein